MDLYVLLSVVIVCITFIICFIINNFKDISFYYEYKNDHFELKRLRDEYNENITEYQTQVEYICNKIDKLKIFDDNYIKKDHNLVSLIFSLKQILNTKTEDNRKIEAFTNIINNFTL